MARDLPHVGLLDHRVTVLRAVATVSDYNEPVETFSSYITVWMRRIDVSMGETVRAAEVGADITAHFVVRYSPEVATVTPKDRLQLEDGLLYDITGVRELARNQWLEIHAVARADR